MFPRLVALAATLGLLVVGCGSGSPGDGAGPSATATGGGGAAVNAVNAGQDEPAGTGDGAATATATGEPIKLGAISSHSGFDIFPEPATMARLVFKRYNEQGGLDGRPIQLVSVDDQNTLDGAATGAKRLLDEEGVVGLCCGGSISDCPANAGFYAERGVEVVPAAAACVEAQTVHPINAGPFIPALHLLDFLSRDLDNEKICFTGYNVGLNEVFKTEIAPLWEQASGLTLDQIVIEPGEDLTPLVTALVADGCDAVLAAFTELNYQSFFHVVDAQGAGDDIDFGMLTSGYSLSLLDSAGGTLEGVYVGSELEPFTGDPGRHSSETRDFLALAEEVGILPTSFGQAGYLSANIMIEVLESIEGEITFESVQEAIRNVSYPTEMLGATFTASGYVDGSQPNQTSQILRVDGRDFVPAADGWRRFPSP